MLFLSFNISDLSILYSQIIHPGKKTVQNKYTQISPASVIRNLRWEKKRQTS